MTKLIVATLAAFIALTSVSFAGPKQVAEPMYFTLATGRAFGTASHESRSLVPGFQQMFGNLSGALPILARYDRDSFETLCPAVHKDYRNSSHPAFARKLPR